MQPQASIGSILDITEQQKNKNLIPLLSCKTYLHASGLHLHRTLGSYLVSAFVQAGSLSIAQKVFDGLLYRSQIAWESLINGYIRYGNGSLAFKLYPKMLESKIWPAEHTFVALVQANRMLKDVKEGVKLHDFIYGSGILQTNVYIGNMLLDMYIKCGSVEKAMNLHDVLPDRNVVSWTTLITGYLQCEKGDRALKSFDQVLCEGILPNDFTYACILKACRSTADIRKGKQLHASIVGEGLLYKNFVIGSALIDMYAKYGLLVEAHEVFDMLPFRDTVTWTALIAGHSQHGHGEEALSFFEQMQIEGVCPNSVTFASTLKGCSIVGDSSNGREIHCEVTKRGLLEGDHVLGASLVDMYVKCGLVAEAKILFNRVPVRDVVMWNALITGYVESQCGGDALLCYGEMCRLGVSPDTVTYISILKACGSIGDAPKGNEIHNEILKSGVVDGDVAIGNALLDMYAKCGLPQKMKEVFDGLLFHDVVSWTTLIIGYIEHAVFDRALSGFMHMQMEGISPDAITYTCCIKACVGSRAIHKGVQIHSRIASKFLETDVALSSALLDMYMMFGMVTEAHDVFDSLASHDLLLWTTMITGYMNNSCNEEAIDCYGKMQLEGIRLDAVTLSLVLKACGAVGAVDMGKAIHKVIEKHSLLKTDNVLGNALVDMYAKCGLLTKAQEVFDNIRVRDVVSWTALITGYGQRGEAANVIKLFDQMRREGQKPNPVTFVCVLNACSHAGLVDRGEMYFNLMVEEYGINPTIEHNTCMIDLFGRAGQLRKAVDIMKSSPSYPHTQMWLTVLGACRKWGDVELGREAFEQVIKLDKHEVSAYICMWNIYTDAGLENDAKSIEAMRFENTCRTSI